MTEAVGSTLVRRHIGRRFAALRQQAGLTMDQAAKHLDRSRATLSRIEDGDEGVRFREIDVRQMLDLYAAPEAEREALLALTAQTRNARRKSWWHDYTATELPQWFGLYVSLEDSAETIRQYEPELVPGLLQTRAYADQVTRVLGSLLDEAEIARRVEVRMERQDLLHRPRAPRLEVVITDATLQRTIGAGDLAAEQLQHLLDVTHRSNVILQVLPASAGIHAGMASSTGFSLLQFPTEPLSGEPLEPPLAYVESPTGAMYLTKPSEVAIYDLIWTDLTAKALDPEASRQAVTRMLEGLTS